MSNHAAGFTCGKLATTVAYLLDTSEVHAQWLIDVLHTFANTDSETMSVVVDLVLTSLNGQIPSDDLLDWAEINPARK